VVFKYWFFGGTNSQLCHYLKAVIYFFINCRTKSSLIPWEHFHFFTKYWWQYCDLLYVFFWYVISIKCITYKQHSFFTYLFCSLNEILFFVMEFICVLHKRYDFLLKIQIYPKKLFLKIVRKPSFFLFCWKFTLIFDIFLERILRKE
jgi:hypothetical protein